MRVNDDVENLNLNNLSNSNLVVEDLYESSIATIIFLQWYIETLLI